MEWQMRARIPSGSAGADVIFLKCGDIMIEQFSRDGIKGIHWGAT